MFTALIVVLLVLVIWLVLKKLNSYKNEPVVSLNLGLEEKKREKRMSAIRNQVALRRALDKGIDPNSYTIEQLVEQYKEDTAEEGINAAVKEFGLASLAKEGTEQEIKNILIDQAPVDAPKIIFEQTSYDFGQVSQADGIVFTYFPIKNKGESNLVIDKLSTSCGCTLASIVYQGEEGPTFTMPGHGKENPANWSVEIAPGDEAQLKIYYDPNTHGEQKEDVLPVTRTISIFSNDPVEFEKQVRIDLNQTP